MTCARCDDEATHEVRLEGARALYCSACALETWRASDHLARVLPLYATLLGAGA